MIESALRAAAAYLDDKASSSVWDSHQRLSDEQRFAKVKKVNLVAEELRALADTSKLHSISFNEYAVLKDILYAFGTPLALKLDQDIAIAFREAAGPAQPRQKGWLKTS